MSGCFTGTNSPIGYPAVAVGSNSVLVGAGYPLSGSVYSINPSNGISTRLDNVIATPRRFMACTSNNGIALFAGGIDSNGSPSTVVNIYNFGSNYWTELPTGLHSAEGGRYFLSATSVVASNKAVFAGGNRGQAISSSGGGASGKVDIFSYDTSTWVTTAMSQPRFGLASFALGNKVYIAGGQISNNLYAVNIDVVDTNPGFGNAIVSVSAGFSLSLPRGFLVGISNNIFGLFAGGTTQTNLGPVATDVVDIFNSVTLSWFTTTMSLTRTNFAATVLGRFIIFAGGCSSTTIEAFDSFGDGRSILIFSAATLSIPRYNLAAFTIGSGYLAVFLGGDVGNSTADSNVGGTSNWQPASAYFNSIDYVSSPSDVCLVPGNSIPCCPAPMYYDGSSCLFCPEGYYCGGGFKAGYF